MTSEGRLFDTYVAALQHDLVDLPAGTTAVGVVRRPTRWFHPQVDENVPALAPPEALLAAVQEQEETLTDQGLDNEDAHNRAWEAVDFDRRYRAYLDDDVDAQAALEGLRRRLRNGEALALVCYENTDDKRCHRTTLREYLE